MRFFIISVIASIVRSHSPQPCPKTHHNLRRNEFSGNSMDKANQARSGYRQPEGAVAQSTGHDICRL